MNLIKQKKPKDKLSHKQMDLLRKQKSDAALTADWLRDNNLDTAYFNTTNINLLQATKSANELLNNHIKLLTNEQISKLNLFLKLMSNKNTRSKLKSQHAYPILNINTKINRLLFMNFKHTQ
jgi:hypothetical protein